MIHPNKRIMNALPLLVTFCKPVVAFDGGDTGALIIGLIISIFGIFACLGAYARKLNMSP